MSLLFSYINGIWRAPEHDGIPRDPQNHSHSIVLSDGNALNFKCKFFLHTTKSRLADPSEIRALEIQGEFSRFAICSVSTSIDIDWSIFLEVLREDGVSTLPKKTVSDGEVGIRL